MGSVSASVYASSSGKYVNATVTWGLGPQVTVNANSNGSWRLVQRGNSSIVYLSSAYANSSYYDTFEAVDGGQYIFQVYCTVEEQYYNDSFDTSGFTVNFGSDEGGDSGGSSGGGVSSLNLQINQGEGTKLVVERTWTNGAASSEILTNGAVVYAKHDVFKISADPLDGYDIDYYELGSTTHPFKLVNFEPYGELVRFRIPEGTTSNPSVTSTAKLKQYTLSITAGEWSSITVTRIRSKHPDGAIGKLESGDTIYHFDELEVVFESYVGHEILTHTVNGETHASGDIYVVTGETLISTTTRVSGIAYIYDGTTFERYLIHIYDGDEWSQYIPYIYNGTSWDICS